MEKQFKNLLLLFSSSWIFIQYSAYSFPPDVGDGLTHFFIAEGSWVKPDLFLHHWGKPFFILLSSSFAQLGFVGMVLFNIVVFLITVVFGWRILNFFKTPIALQVLLPCFLLLTKDYVDTLIGGMTEPLFSAILMLATWCFIEKKHVFFTILIGFLPFCRSEGQMVVLIGILALLLVRHWKSVLFLLLPFLLYSLVATVFLGDFWWYFTQSPYHMDNDIYGHGNGTDYILSYKNYLGNHGLFTFILAFCLFIFTFFKKPKTLPPFSLLLLFFAPFFGILAAHSYFWANGLNGSLGLTRIATQGMPSLMVGSLVIIGINLHFNWLKNLKYSAVLGLGLIVLLVTKLNFDLVDKEFDKTIYTSTITLKKQNLPVQTTYYYHHPLFAYKMGFNPLLPTSTSVFYLHKTSMQGLKQNMKFGDIISWDSNFGPQEMDLPYDSLLLDPNFILVSHSPTNGNANYNGFSIFQYVPAKYKVNKAAQEKQRIVYTDFISPSQDEFSNLYLLRNNSKMRQFRLSYSGNTTSLVVVTNKDNSYYFAERIDHNTTHDFVFKNEELVTFYVWNPEKEMMKDVKIKLIEFKSALYPYYKSVGSNLPAKSK